MLWHGFACSCIIWLIHHGLTVIVFNPRCIGLFIAEELTMSFAFFRLSHLHSLDYLDGNHRTIYFAAEELQVIEADLNSWAGNQFFPELIISDLPKVSTGVFQTSSRGV